MEPFTLQSLTSTSFIVSPNILHKRPRSPSTTITIFKCTTNSPSSQPSECPFSTPSITDRNSINHRAIPVHSRLPFIGTLFGQSNLTLSQRYGSVFQVEIFGSDMTVVVDPKLIAHVLHAADSFIARDATPSFYRLLGRHTFFNYDGTVYSRSRSLLSSVLLPSLRNHVQNDLNFMAFWHRLFENKMQNFVLFEEIRTFFLRAVLDVTGAKHVQCTDRLIQDFMHVEHGLFTPVRDLNPLWYRARRAHTRLCKIANEVISSERIISNSHPILRQLASADIQGDPAENLVFLWLAGHATLTWSSLASIAVLACRHDITTELRKQNQNDSLLQSFVHEVHRLYPPLYTLQRVAVTNTHLDDISIPSGNHLLLDLYTAQRHSKYYRDPEEFQLNRFLRRNEVQQNVSFGVPGTQHYCLGASYAHSCVMKLVETLINEFDIELEDKYNSDVKTILQNGVRIKRLVRL